MALRVGGAPAVPSKISPCHQTPAASRLKYFWLDLTQVTFRLLSLSGWAVSSLLLLQSLWVLLDELLMPSLRPRLSRGLRRNAALEHGPVEGSGRSEGPHSVSPHSTEV